MIVKAKVKTGQKEFRVEEGEIWKISCRSRAKNNEANAEIVKKLSRIYGRARIIRGLKSRVKTIDIGKK